MHPKIPGEILKKHDAQGDSLKQSDLILYLL